MSESNERQDMVHQIRTRGRYTRTTEFGTVQYWLDNAGDTSNVAVWEVSGSAPPDNAFDISLRKAHNSRDDALQYLQDHFNDPITISQTMRGL